MERKDEETEIYPIWVDWDNRIISFAEAEGFEKIEYATHAEMFEFAVKKGFSGFGIQ